MFDKIKYYYNVATDKYFVSVDYVEGKPIPEVVEKNYIVYNDKDGSMDYTKTAKDATCFGFVLGSLIVAELKAKCKDLPNLHFSLISCADAAFVETIQTGSAVAFDSSKKGPIDFAAKELAKQLSKNPNVNGVGVIGFMDTDKKTNVKYIGVSVKDKATKMALQKTYPNDLYKGFKIKYGVEIV